MPSTDKFVSLLGFSAIEILAWTSTALSANEDEEIVDRRGRVGRMKAMPMVQDRLPLELFSIAQSDLTSQLRHLSWIPDAPSGKHITGRNTRMVAVDVDGEALIIDSKCGLYGFFVTLPPTASHHTFCIDVAPIPGQPHIRVTLNAPHDGILGALCLHLDHHREAHALIQDTYGTGACFSALKRRSDDVEVRFESLLHCCYYPDDHTKATSSTPLLPVETETIHYKIQVRLRKSLTL
jgi:hypothetical protein